VPLNHSFFLVYECVQTNSCLISSVHKLGSWISLIISLISSIFCPLRIWQGCIQPGSLCGGTMGILMRLIYKSISRALTLLWFLARYAHIWHPTLFKCKKMTFAIGVCMTTLHMVIGSNDARHTLVATHRTWPAVMGASRGSRYLKGCSLEWFWEKSWVMICSVNCLFKLLGNWDS
jgi:hypothetical protein